MQPGRSWTALAALLAAVAPSGCGSSEGRSDVGSWGDVELVEELRIGVFEEPAEYLFGRVSSVAPAPDKSCYVFDFQLKSIRYYAADGTFVRNVGAKGQGPGEYDRPREMKLLPDGSLVVLDATHRFILYRPDGTYLRDFRFEAPMFMTQHMLHVDHSGHLYYVTLQEEPRPGMTDYLTALTKLSTSGDVLDLIPLPRRNSDGGYAFSVATLHAWSPLGYLIVGRNDSYAFTVAAGTEDSVHVRREFEPVAVHPEERDEWQRYVDFTAERARQRGQNMSYPALPEFKPAYRSIRVGDEGHIWIHRHVSAEKDEERASSQGAPPLSWRERSTFDVFDPDGTFLCTVLFAKGEWPYAMRGRYVWCVAQTPEGERVVRYRVEAKHTS